MTPSTKRSFLQKQRDEAIVAILTPEQKAQYAALTQRPTADQFSTLGSQRDAVFREGVEETKKLLDDAQKAKYDRILRDRIGSVPSGIPGSYSSGSFSAQDANG